MLRLKILINILFVQCNAIRLVSPYKIRKKIIIMSEDSTLYEEPRFRQCNTISITLYVLFVSTTWCEGRYSRQCMGRPLHRTTILSFTMLLWLSPFTETPSGGSTKLSLVHLQVKSSDWERGAKGRTVRRQSDAGDKREYMRVLVRVHMEVWCENVMKLPGWF